MFCRDVVVASNTLLDVSVDYQIVAYTTNVINFKD